MTITRQPGHVHGALEIEPSRAPLWKDDHGLHVHGVMTWVTSPTSPGRAKHNVHVEPVLKRAPLWVGSHGNQA